jgi:hypothetical protein
MDPFTIALATFGVQKLRGKSTNRALRDAVLAGGIGQLGGMAGMGGLQAFGQSAPLANRLIGNTFGQQFGQTATMRGLGSLFPQLGANQTAANIASSGADPGTAAGLVGNEGSFLSRLMPKTTAGRLGAGFALTSLLGGMGGGGDEERVMRLPIPNQAYTKFAKSGAPGTPTGFMTRDYTTGTNAALEDPTTYKTVEEILGAEPTQQFKEVRFNSGGIVNVAKFNEGGQALPSKYSHDEDDLNNYVRAQGFVKDGAGFGDDNEDTMLAQLADGEFVSRAAAVRGAGILAGASINDKSEQRKKGAEYFYEQQKRFKRIFDLLDASRKDN